MRKSFAVTWLDVEVAAPVLGVAPVDGVAAEGALNLEETSPRAADVSVVLVLLRLDATLPAAALISIPFTDPPLVSLL